MEKCDRKLRNVGSHQNLAKAKNRFFPRDWRKCGSASILEFGPVKLILDFLPPDL